jgi:tRNA threonylcarbamoyladenosine biosynthesis protein TsaE
MGELAEALAATIQPGDVVTLDGPLGAGKTTFSQRFAKALGVQESVSSPTFVLIQEYHSGRTPLVHVDLYRLGAEKAHSLADELLSIADEGHSVILVEWACYGDFLEPLANIRLQLAYDPENPNARTLTIQSQRPLPTELNL